MFTLVSPRQFERRNPVLLTRLLVGVPPMGESASFGSLPKSLPPVFTVYSRSQPSVPTITTVLLTY